MREERGTIEIKIGNTYLKTFLRMVPSPSRGIRVIFLNLKPFSSANRSSACAVMSTNLLLEEGSCTT